MTFTSRREERKKKLILSVFANFFGVSFQKRYFATPNPQYLLYNPLKRIEKENKIPHNIKRKKEKPLLQIIQFDFHGERRVYFKE